MVNKALSDFFYYHTQLLDSLCLDIWVKLIAHGKKSVFRWVRNTWTLYFGLILVELSSHCDYFVLSLEASIYLLSYMHPCLSTLVKQTQFLKYIRLVRPSNPVTLFAPETSTWRVTVWQKISRSFLQRNVYYSSWNSNQSWSSCFCVMIQCS